MSTSGTTNFLSELTNADMVLEAYNRLQIRPNAITPEHLVSARISMNLVLVMWSNLGVNLWKVELLTTVASQGTATYGLPADTVKMLDTYLRTYQLPTAANPTSLETTMGSASVLVNQPNHGLIPGMWVSVVTQIAIGGIVVGGFYPVVTVPSPDSFTITADVALSSSALGVVPLYTSDSGSSGITVTLANNGLAPNETFTVGVATFVGGITLTGGYQVISVLDSDNFTIDPLVEAATSESVFENDGTFLFNEQSTSNPPIDRILYPISRNDYAAMPNKFVQAPPTTYWFDRQITPQFTLWQVPDQNGPYEIRCYRMLQMEDSNLVNGQTSDLPYRFLEAFISALAAHLALKWAPGLAKDLNGYAEAKWEQAMGEDREIVSYIISPTMYDYWN